MDLFDCIKYLFNKRGAYPTDDILSGKMWMVNRFLSMDSDLTEFISYVSKYFFTLGNRYYRLLYRLIPQTSAPRIPYLKAKKEFDDVLLTRYASYFQIGKGQAADYLRILQKKYTAKQLYEYVGLETNGKN